MSDTARISTLRRVLPVMAALLAAVPAQAQDIPLAPGEELATRVDGDLNGDGVGDIAYISQGEETRSLTVLLSVRHEFDFEWMPETLELGPTLFGPGSLAIAGNVLTLVDLTGGTTAHSTTYRFRYDAARKRMRLIGLDVTLYSRMFAHDGFEASWNMLTGDAITRELKLNEGAGDAAYNPTRERRFKRRTPAVWLADSPDPETVLDELSNG